MNTATPSPLVFIYDRNATRSSAILDLRLSGCVNYADRHGWQIAGLWVDRGDNALSTTRPQFSALVESMGAQAGRRATICLVHHWCRLAHDDALRRTLQQRVARARGCTATTFGDSDEQAHAALAGLGRGRG
ncbi:recombinase family protein [Streptomyces sp. Ac-502]|uniref:recombinase family protein n=1 Tax=Streptomyces sp. Ac-502 TaxID=3342801 RepID=UPI0038629284